MEDVKDEQVIGPYTMESDGFLGRGTFGPVIRSKKSDSSEMFAIKKISKLLIIENNMSHEMKNIIANIRTLRHQNIVIVHDILMSENNICLCMEYVNGKKLINLIGEEGNIRSRLACKYSRQICNALSYSHAQGISNQNINPFTILINEHDNIKLLGFDLINDSLIHDTLYGNFIAPEIRDVNLQRGSGTKQDMWAVGMTIYYMRMGYLPKNCSAPFKDIPLCMKLGMRPNKRIRKVITNLISISPEKRKSAEEILEFNWFQ